MRRLVSVVAKVCFIAALLLIVAIVTFDRLSVAPELAKAEAILAAADAAERDLPKPIKSALQQSLGANLKYLVARTLLVASPSQTDGMKTTSRQLTELGVGLMLPLHLSDDQLLSIEASRAYMGPGVQGFARASEVHLGVPLAKVNKDQAVRLVVIARAPTAYLENPERLERNVQAMLAKQAE